MTAKIVEVIAQILDALSKNSSLEEVNKTLSHNKNFDKQTVSTAFSWIYDKKLTNNYFSNSIKNKEIKSFRFLTEEEKEILGVENYDYITHLINVGLLKLTDLDNILEQITLFPGDKISKEEINWLILFSLVDLNESIPPGSRVLLYSSDTIN
ncbi:MAG TPA: DUF494 family protein [Ignavibacteriales bacterium]|nr:DUF494 family protein [Ignavibacteriales bacterium]